jgi:hypothetical protein
MGDGSRFRCPRVRKVRERGNSNRRLRFAYLARMRHPADARTRTIA